MFSGAGTFRSQLCDDTCEEYIVDYLSLYNDPKDNARESVTAG